MNTDDEIVQIIHDMIKPEYLINSKMYLTINKSNYNSINVISDKTSYRDAPTNELLFATIKTTGKSQYISFGQQYYKLFRDKGIVYTQIDKRIRISLDVFSSLSGYLDIMPDIMNKIFLDIFSFPPFGCCSKYIECSDAKRCLHDDMAYSSVCQYRANLENGNIFYGKNRNICVGDEKNA